MVTQYFLGGNTAAGFVSFYDGFCHGEEDFLWVIKGGPGCGKSSFMRRIGAAAEQAGQDVQYVLCSGDPDSLDGVYIPGWHTGYVDGTAPHVIEAELPGAAALYLDLGQFYDRQALMGRRGELAALQLRYRALYRRAYACLQSYDAPQPPLPDTRAHGSRFLRAVTCRGIVALEPPAGAVQLVQPEQLAVFAAQPDAVWYRHPLWPGRLEAVWLPRQRRYYRGPDIPMPELTEAESLLAQAKQLHDELEAIYNPHVDFARVYALANSHTFRLSHEN